MSEAMANLREFEKKLSKFFPVSIIVVKVIQDGGSNGLMYQLHKQTNKMEIIRYETRRFKHYRFPKEEPHEVHYLKEVQQENDA